MDLQPVHAPACSEEEYVVVRGRDEEVLDPVLLFSRHPRHTTAAAPLPPVGIHRHPLHVALVGDGDHHLLLGDEVLHREVHDFASDLGAALISVLLNKLV